jgi:hypothetical protein
MAPQDPLEREAWAAGYQAGFRDAYNLVNAVKQIRDVRKARKKPRRKK